MTIMTLCTSEMLIQELCTWLLSFWYNSANVQGYSHNTVLLPPLKLWLTAIYLCNSDSMLLSESRLETILVVLFILSGSEHGQADISSLPGVLSPAVREQRQRHFSRGHSGLRQQGPQECETPQVLTGHQEMAQPTRTGDCSIRFEQIQS